MMATQIECEDSRGMKTKNVENMKEKAALLYSFYQLISLQQPKEASVITFPINYAYFDVIPF